MYASPRSRRHACDGVRAVHALAPLRASNLRAKALAVTLQTTAVLATTTHAMLLLRMRGGAGTTTHQQHGRKSTAAAGSSSTAVVAFVVVFVVVQHSGGVRGVCGERRPGYIAAIVRRR